MKTQIFIAAALVTLAGCSQEASVPEADTAPTEKSASADAVEIALNDPLDGATNEYCLDIAGGRENVDPANGLQGHTCYSRDGALGTDQIFDANLFAQNTLFMPEYDVCVEAADGAISLAACDEGDAQKIAFGEDGTIRPASDETQCFTLAEDTRTGKSTENQIKALALAECSEENAAYQVWRARKTDDTPNG